MYRRQTRILVLLLVGLIVTFNSIRQTIATAQTATCIELLSQPWHLAGNNGASEKYQDGPATVLQGKTSLKITYDLHGLQALTGDASAIIFDQNGWQYISLSNYGQNGKNG